MSASFEFEPAYLDKARMYIARYPAGRQQSAVLPLLDLAQRQNGGTLPDGAMQAIATMLEMPYIRVVEVATFYTMVHIKPVGKHLLQCCTTTPCWLRGSSEVVDAIRDHLGIEMGETTADGLFTLTEVECLGGCVNAPIVQINDDFYEDLDAKNVVKVLNALQKGEIPPHGSQIGRQGSAPEGGPRVLTGTAAAKE